MSGDCFLVLRDDSSGTPRWVVRKGERAYGEYLSEEAALADALEAAQDAREGGAEVRVLLDAGDGAAPVEWGGETVREETASLPQ
jgi:hypothetical protein